MPAKGHRKDQLLDRQVYVRYLTPEYEQLKIDATNRSMTVSKLVRALTEAHYTGKRAQLKQARGYAASVIRELNRIGNNINQLTRMANTGMVSVSERELREQLAGLQATIAKL